MVCGAEVTSEGIHSKFCWLCTPGLLGVGGSPLPLGNHCMPQISNYICYGCSFTKIIRITVLSEIRANGRWPVKPTLTHITHMLRFWYHFKNIQTKGFQKNHTKEVHLYQLFVPSGMLEVACVCINSLFTLDRTRPTFPMQCQTWKYFRCCSISPILAELLEYF